MCKDVANILLLVPVVLSDVLRVQILISLLSVEVAQFHDTPILSRIHVNCSLPTSSDFKKNARIDDII